MFCYCCSMAWNDLHDPGYVLILDFVKLKPQCYGKDPKLESFQDLAKTCWEQTDDRLICFFFWFSLKLSISE